MNEVLLELRGLGWVGGCVCVCVGVCVGGWVGTYVFVVCGEEELVEFRKEVGEEEGRSIFGEGRNRGEEKSQHAESSRAYARAAVLEEGEEIGEEAVLFLGGWVGGWVGR